MAVQGKHRFTTQEYHRMGEMGVLHPDARVELIDGEIIDMSPIGPFHGSVVKQLNELFNQLSRGRWLVVNQDPVRLDDHSEPEPDLMLVKRSADFYKSSHPTPNDVFLLIEVADTTLEMDRERKLPLYGRAGIQEVWIVNLIDRVIEIYREPNFTGYGKKIILPLDGKASLSTFPEVYIDVSKLFQ